MPDQRWGKIVDSVIRGVEPDTVKRLALKTRLVRNGTLATLHAHWRMGRSSTKIALRLRELALQAAIRE